MPILTQDCPHCRAAKVGFLAVMTKENPTKKNHWTTFLLCPSCNKGLVAEIFDHGTGRDPMGHLGNFDLPSQGFSVQVTETWPRPMQLSIPAHLPDRVAKAFKEGCQVKSASPSAACTQFRKALEFGLKDLAPEIEAWKLEKRIDRLAERGILTAALRDWAHHLRIDGNESVHGDEDPTIDHAQAVEQLTRYVLTYIYTLPKSIELARGAS